MFFKILNKIRKKPESSRELIALGISLVVGGIIALSWAIYFIPHAGEALGKTNMADVIGPFNKVSDVASKNPFLNTTNTAETANTNGDVSADAPLSEDGTSNASDTANTDQNSTDVSTGVSDSGQDTGQNDTSGAGASR